MHKRKVYLLLLAGAVLAPVLVVVFSREREPEYAGKRLSEWVEIYAATGTVVSAQTQKEDAANAIRHIGTRAPPFLLKWMQYEPAPWKSRLCDEVNRRLKLSLPLADERKTRRALAAMNAFHVLGPQADRALPELTRLLNDPAVSQPTRWEPHATPYRAALVLAGLGEAGLPPLEALFANQQADHMLRYIVARDIMFYGTKGRTNAYRALRAMLTSPDGDVRKHFTNALESINSETLAPF